MAPGNLINLKHVQIGETLDEHGQLTAVVVCPVNNVTKPYVLTRSGEINFDCVHGKSQIGIKLAGDRTMFQVNADYFIPEGTEYI